MKVCLNLCATLGIGFVNAEHRYFSAPNDVDLTGAQMFPPQLDQHYIYGITVCSAKVEDIGASENPNVIVGIGFDSVRNDGKQALTNYFGYDCFETPPEKRNIDACFKHMQVYTTQIMDENYVTRIEYELSTGEVGSVGGQNGNEKELRKWDFSPGCATGYSVKIENSYPEALIALEIKSDDDATHYEEISGSEHEAHHSNLVTNVSSHDPDSEEDKAEEKPTRVVGPPTDPQVLKTIKASWGVPEKT